MIRIVLLLILSLEYLAAEVKLPPIKIYKSINECQSDIYYGNGIMTPGFSSIVQFHR